MNAPTITKADQLADIVRRWFVDECRSEDATLTITITRGDYTLEQRSRTGGHIDMDAIAPDDGQAAR